MNTYFVSVFISVLVVEISSFTTMSSLQNVVFTNIDYDFREFVHSEYYFGECTNYESRELLAREYITYSQVVGNIIVRGVFDSNIIFEDKLPNCIYLKAISPFSDMVKYNAYQFNMCIGIIIYYYPDQSIFRYPFYEWFVPVAMQIGIDWDIYFYYSR